VTHERLSHAARPTDLVALVTFDDQVRENQAVTMESLADPSQRTTHPLNAALAQWLHLGRRMWINVDGREVRGIATARDLNTKHAWVIDTLIEAAGADAGDEVVTDLLGQASEAAADAQVTHLLLRTEVDAPAREAATRAGFRPTLIERSWRGTVVPFEAAADTDLGSPRPAEDGDDLSLFQLYGRAFPVDARAQLGMTREEWSAVRDRRWLRGGMELVVERAGTVAGRVGLHEQEGRVQIEILVEPGDQAGAAALLTAAVEHAGTREVQMLVPRCVDAVEAVAARAGLEAESEYVRLVRRIARPVLDTAPVRSGMPVPTGGGA